MVSDPSDDELIAFAATLLGGRDKTLADPELLRETIHEAHALWVLLYRAHHGHEVPDAEGRA